MATVTFIEGEPDVARDKDWVVAYRKRNGHTEAPLPEGRAREFEAMPVRSTVRRWNDGAVETLTKITGGRPWINTDTGERYTNSGVALGGYYATGR